MQTTKHYELQWTYTERGATHPVSGTPRNPIFSITFGSEEEARAAYRKTLDDTDLQKVNSLDFSPTEKELRQRACQLAIYIVTTDENGNENVEEIESSEYYWLGTNL